MTGFRITFFAASLWLFAAPAVAQQRSGPAWGMSWGDQNCILARLPDHDTPFVVAIRIVPGSAYADILLMPQGERRPPSQIDAVRLGPSGSAFPVTAGHEETGHGVRVVALHGLPYRFVELLAGTTEIQFRHGDRDIGQAHLVNAAGAARALRQCISAALRDWDIDEAALTALRERPISTNVFGISDADFPRESVVRGDQGRVVLRVDVSAQGRVTACAPVETSGTPALDAAACHAALARGRFRPAINAAGEPTAARIVAPVRFWIP